MKTSLYLAFLLCVFSSCGIKVPATESYHREVPDKYTPYLKDLRSIADSRLSDAEKDVANSRLLEYHTFRYSMDSLIKTNEHIILKNDKANDVYSYTTGIIGGLGALSAAIPDINVLIPVATGVWTLLGLSIQKIFVQPRE